MWHWRAKGGRTLGTGVRIATASVRTGLAMTRFLQGVRYKACGRTESSAPTKALQEVRCGEESPSHGFAVPAPFRQGAEGTGDADCHDQFANWSRNDTFSRSAVQAQTGGVEARTGGVEPRPYGGVARGAGKESPSHGVAATAPFRQGGQGGGGCGLPQPVCELASQ